MKNKIPKYWIPGVVILLVIQFLSPCNVAYAGVVTPPFTRCNIEIGDAHISENLLRTRALIAVKVNASSKCDKPIQGLVITVEIYKVGLLLDHQVARKSVSVKGVVSQNRVIKNQKTYVKCRSNKWTKFYGIAHAEAKVNGKNMKTYPVRSENIERLQCGN
ncbi:MAG: hypothetical protein FGM60_05580 [Candidatus Planktophila sp.]|nr:hypothetical protein [Candidatus Planktophila sp.]